MGSTVAAGWANVSLAAAASSAAGGAAVSTINNRGNLGAVLKDVTSDQALKGYAVGAVTAGLTAGVFDNWTSTETGANAAGAATGNTGALANSGAVATAGGLSSWTGVGQFAANQALQNGTSTLLNKALGQGGSLGDALQTTLANTFAAAGFNLIGDMSMPGQWDLKDGSLAKIGLHAVMGGLAAEAAGGDFKTGALAAGVNEALVGSLAEQYAGMDPDKKKGLLVMNSQLIGVLAAAAQGGDEKDLQTGAWVAGSATQHNFLNHQDVKEMEAALKQCASDQNCERGVRAQFQERSASNLERLNNCSTNGTCAAIQQEIQGGLDALGSLKDLSGTAQNVVGLFASNQAGQLDAAGARVSLDASNQKRDQDLVALGKDAERLQLTVKASALAEYQKTLEQELLANAELQRLADKSDADLDMLAPGWREYRQQVLNTTGQINAGMGLAGDVLEPGLLDAIGPAAKAAKLAGVFAAMRDVGRGVLPELTKVAGKLDDLLMGKTPSPLELAPFEKKAESRLTAEIQKANQSLASKPAVGSGAGAARATGGPVNATLQKGLHQIFQWIRGVKTSTSLGQTNTRRLVRSPKEALLLQTWILRP